MTARIKADTKTLMHQKVINIFIIVISFLFTACAEDSKDNQDNILQDNTTKYDFVYNEHVVIYSIYGSYDTGNIERNSIIENITLSFNNILNEEVYILIPESNDNKAYGVSFILSNHNNNKCRPLENCSITFNMLVKEKSPLNNDFTVYLPVTLLNQQEMNTFLEMNMEEKYKTFAMKYLTNRIYIKFRITGSVS